MSRYSFPQYAQIQQPFGCAPSVVHCPICGQATLKNDKEGLGEFTPCPHLAFIFIGATGEFAYRSDDFTKRCDCIDPESYYDDTIEELLIKAGYCDNMLAIEITYGGLAGGPLCFTDVYGFDYETMIPKGRINRIHIV